MGDDETIVVTRRKLEEIELSFRFGCYDEDDLNYCKKLIRNENITIHKGLANTKT